MQNVTFHDHKSATLNFQKAVIEGLSQYRAFERTCIDCGINRPALSRAQIRDPSAFRPTDLSAR